MSRPRRGQCRRTPEVPADRDFPDGWVDLLRGDVDLDLLFAKRTPMPAVTGAHRPLALVPSTATPGQRPKAPCGGPRCGRAPAADQP